MADVYSRATKVLVWLGPESEDSHLAINRLEYIATRVEMDWSTKEIFPMTNEAHWADLSVVTTLTEDDFAALFNLIGRPWFSRLWILQEVHLATADIEVICGNHKILWSTVRTAVYFLSVKPKYWFAQEQEFETRIGAVYHLCAVGGKRLPIDVLISNSKDSVCLDPRDKIYGLIGLANVPGIDKYEVNYSITDRQSLQYLVRFMLESTKKLDCICYASFHKGLPSWVPYWAPITVWTFPNSPLPAIASVFWSKLPLRFYRQTKLFRPLASPGYGQLFEKDDSGQEILRGSQYQS